MSQGSGTNNNTGTSAQVVCNLDDVSVSGNPKMKIVLMNGYNEPVEYSAHLNDVRIFLGGILECVYRETSSVSFHLGTRDEPSSCFYLKNYKSLESIAVKKNDTSGGYYTINVKANFRKDNGDLVQLSTLSNKILRAWYTALVRAGHPVFSKAGRECTQFN